MAASAHVPRHATSREAVKLVTVAEWDAMEARMAAAERDLAAHLALPASRAHGHVLPDAAWLQVLASSTKGSIFSTRELLVHSQVDPDLRRAIRGCCAKRIGKRLCRLAGRDVGGFTVERHGRDEQGVLWVVTVSGSHLQDETGDGPA